MNLLKTVDLLINLAQGPALVQREAHDTALLCNGLQNALTNPPNGIRDELEASRLVKLLSSLHQSDIAFVNKVGKRQTLMLVLLGYGNDESKVGCYQTLLRTLPLTASLTDGLCQFDLLLNGYKGLTTNLDEILVKCLTRTIGNALLNL